jgi:multidrug efflux system membrane fusion protein
VTLGNKTVIQRGIEAGDTVVTDGQLRLVPGAQVTIKEGPATTPTSQAGPS